MFHYSSYWHTWSRILSQKDGVYCELNLTPINGFQQGNLDSVKLEVIRIHWTMPDKNDKNCESLPDNVLNEMKHYLDHDLVERLLNHDYLTCSDHRDKVRDLPCRQCTVESLLKSIAMSIDVLDPDMSRHEIVQLR